MSVVTIEDTNLTNIANAIRSKNGTSTKYKPSEMATAISNITTGGVEPTGTINITENGTYDVTDYASANVNVPTGGGTITKGIVINSADSNGFATDVSIVGMTELPFYYLYYAAYYSSSGYNGWLSKIGSNLHLPNNLTRIHQRALGYCTNLTLTELPDSIKWIDDYAFAYDTNLALTKLPSSLLTLGMNTFFNCKNIAMTELPSGLSTIGNNCFSGCSKLALKTLPSSIKSLGQACFQNCTGLTELTMLGAITSIGNNTFYGCSNLAKVVFPNITAVPTLSNTSAFNSTPIAKGTGYIYVPDALIDSFKSASNWSTYAAQIKGLSELEAA